MKAVLVIDMPKDCWDCHLVSEFHSCRGTVLQNDFSFKDITNFDKGERPSWCPLKPLPTEFKTYKLSSRDQDETELFINMAMIKVYADGYNACLKEIEE